MPETAVDEYRLFLWTENEIRFSGQVLAVEAVSVAQRVDQFPHHYLRLHVFRSYRRHVFGAPFWRELVHKVKSYDTPPNLTNNRCLTHDPTALRSIHAQQIRLYRNGAS